MAENVTLRFRTKGVGRAIQAFDKLEKNADSLRRVGERMQSVGRGLTLGVTAPLTAAAGAAANMAANAEEAANKFEVVMGDSADEVRARFRELEDTIPVTQKRFEEMTAGLQDLLVPMGVAREQAAGMSAEFFKMAGDIASFNNVAQPRVLEAMESALAGMSRPLRQFGIDVRQARLQQIALNEGLIEAGEEMTRTARAQAVMIAVQRDSEDALGDAARTADEFKNQLRFLKRDAKELATEIGQTLMPHVRNLIEKTRDLVGWMRDLSPATKEIILQVGALAAAMGPLSFIAGQLVLTLAALPTAVGTLSTILGALASGPAAAVVGILAGAGGLVALLSDLGDVAEETREKLDAFTGEVSELSESAARRTLEGLKQSRQRLVEQARRVRDDLQTLRESGASDRLIAGKSALLENLRAQTTEVNRTIAELEQRLGIGLAAGDAGEDAGTQMARGIHDGLVGALFGGQFDIASVFERQAERARRAFVESLGFQTIPGMSMAQRAGASTAGGGGVSMPTSGLQGLDLEKIEGTRESFAELVNVTLKGSDKWKQAAATTVSAFGAMSQAAIRGSDQMATSFIQGITQIVSSLPGVGGLASSVIGAAGGMLSAAFSGGGSNRPQPVSVEDWRHDRPIDVEDQSDRGPDEVIVQVLGSADLGELQGNLKRFTRRDGTERLPQGTRLGG